MVFKGMIHYLLFFTQTPYVKLKLVQNLYREVKIFYLDVSCSVIKSINGGAMVVPKTFRVLASFEKSLN
jgi:hypothetical protein